MQHSRRKKILVLGASGMLGFTLHKYLSTIKTNTVYATTNKKKNFFKSNDNIFSRFDATNPSKFYDLIQQIKPDYVINCIGIIKQRDESNDLKKSILINSIFPKKISIFCNKLKIKFIQISTDCVFDGKLGKYLELDGVNSEDIYGQSKFLGEVYDHNNLTIRTSIIGHEVENKRSLLEWIISKNNHTVNGYQNAYFSGLTTLELSKIIYNYTLNKKIKGLYNIASKTISKYDLIKIIINHYNLNIKLNKKAKFKINRSLNDKKFKNISGYLPKDWNTMIKEQRDFEFNE